MIHDNTTTIHLGKIIVIDTLIITIFLLVPTLCHFASFPLYAIEPIRIAVLLGFLISANKTNAYALAAILPLFSFFVAGHPIFCKSLLIIGEMILNIWLFSKLSKKGTNVFGAMAVSILASKILYYTSKILLIQIGWLQTNLVDTNVMVQIIVLSATSVLFAIFFKSSQNSNR